MPPVSPEQQTANQAVGQAYADAAPTADAQKSALLTAIAQAGQAGAQAAQQQTQVANQGTQQALGQVNQMQGLGMGGAAGVAQVQQNAAAPTEQLAQISRENQMAMGGFSAGLGETNRNYMEALKSAIPLNREWTQRQANSLAARAQSEREAREAQALKDRQAEEEKVEVTLPDGRVVRVSPETALGHYSQTDDKTKWETEKADSDARSLRVSALRNAGAGSSADALSAILLANPTDLAQAEGMLVQAYKTDDGTMFSTPGGAKLSLEALRRYLRYVFSGGELPVRPKAPPRKPTPTPRPNTSSSSGGRGNLLSDIKNAAVKTVGGDGGWFGGLFR